MAPLLKRRDHPLYHLRIDVAIEAHAPAADQLDLDPSCRAFDDDRRRCWRAARLRRDRR
jgi:hypothetical protein